MILYVLNALLCSCSFILDNFWRNGPKRTFWFLCWVFETLSLHTLISYILSLHLRQFNWIHNLFFYAKRVQLTGDISEQLLTQFGYVSGLFVYFSPGQYKQWSHQVDYSKHQKWPDIQVRGNWLLEFRINLFWLFVHLE